MQNLTPLDIQKQTFGKSFNGYAPDEVRAYLHIVAEDLERILKENEKLARDNETMHEELSQYSERELILKQTLLSAQQVSEDVKANARKEAELIVKDAELLSERIISQAMGRVGDLERRILELKVERKAARNRLQTTIETFEQLIMLDAEQEANELPITQLYRKNNE